MLLLAVALIIGSRAATPLAVLVIITGLGAFIAHLAAMLRRRLPPPAALPQPDWATRQTRVAFAFLLIAIATGVLLMWSPAERWRLPLGWTYGVAGLVGFLSEIVVGIQGRLLPLHGWYRVFEARGLQPPGLFAHEAGSIVLARAGFVAWLIGVPALAFGLASGAAPWIRAASLVLLAGVLVNAAHAVAILRRVQSS